MSDAGAAQDAALYELAREPTPLNVLSLSTLFPSAARPGFGGFVERSLIALAAQPGVVLTVIAPVGLPPWPISLLPRYRALHALPQRECWAGLDVLRPRFVALPWVGGWHNPAAIARAVLPLARAMHPHARFDVIDAQFFHPDGAATRRIARARALPYSIKARGSDIAYWAGRRRSRAAVRAAAEGAGGLLAVSDALRDEMGAAGLPAERVIVHYTGVDAALFRPVDRGAARARWAVPEGVPVLVSVGALIPIKGQALVIDALRLLPPGTILLLAGEGPERAALAAQAEAAGIGPRVRFLGRVAHAVMPSLYAAADAMVLASEREGLANVWVEALACGVPLVVSDLPAVREVIDGADAGRAVARTSGAFAAAIRAVLAAPPDRAVLSARTHARFDWDRHGAALAAHLRAVAGVAV